MTLFHNRKHNRLPGYDYSSDNMYFITTNVDGGFHHFGNINNGKMILNEYGKIAYSQWLWLAEQYSYIIQHEFVVMPNHFHGIVEINRKTAGTGCDLSLQQKIKSLSEIIGAFKTTVSKQIHLLGFAEFKWQRSFYNNIIRDEIAFQNITEYILNNPKNWSNDRFFIL